MTACCEVTRRAVEQVQLLTSLRLLVLFSVVHVYVLSVIEREKITITVNLNRNSWSKGKEFNANLNNMTGQITGVLGSQGVL